MAMESVYKHLKAYHLEDRILEAPESSATVELAALAFHCKPEHIAKSIALQKGDSAVIVVVAGDAKIDNAKFKTYFGFKANMVKFEQVETLVGHAVGGVCPFGVNEEIEIYLDESLKRFDILYPAAGTSNSAVKICLKELEECLGSAVWIDVCKNWK